MLTTKNRVEETDSPAKYPGGVRSLWKLRR